MNLRAPYSGPDRQDPARPPTRRLKTKSTATTRRRAGGDTYNDLGATIEGPQADLDLGIQTYLHGAPMSSIQIDTSDAATDTIDYIVTDQTGLTSTTTRTVIIESAQAPSIAPSENAASTSAATTRQ